MMNEKSVRKNVTLGATLGYIAFFLNVLSGLFFTPWLIISFGSSQYGILTLATALVNLFVIDFGLSNATTSFLSRFRAENDKENIEKTLAIIYKTYFIIDAIMLIIFIALYFLSPLIYKGLTIEELELFKKSLLIVAMFSLISLPTTTFNGIINAYEKFAFLKFTDIFQRLLYIGLATATILLELNVYYVLISQAISGLIVIALKFFFIYFSIRVKPNFKSKATKEFIKTVLFYSLTAAFITITSRVSFHFVPNVLGALSTTEEVAFFGVAAMIEGFVFSFGTVISTFFLAKLARINKEKKSIEKTTKLAIKVGRFQFIVISLVIVGFVIVGRDFIKVWMRGDSLYTPVYYCTIILSFFQLIDAPQSLLKNKIYLDSNKIKYHALFEGISTILTVALAFLFVYLFRENNLNPSIGAALSILLSRLTAFTLKNITYQKLTGVNMKRFWHDVYFKQTIISIVIIIITLIILKFFLSEFDYRLRFLFMGSITFIVYIITTIVFNITNEEKLLIKKIFKKS